MHVKTAVIAALPALAVAAPTGSSGQNPANAMPSTYSLVVGTHTDPFHFETVNANSGKFWLNLPETKTSCPSDVKAMGQCPPGVDTAFVGLGALSTVVPGGQQVYVGPDGALMFTAAHSPSMPDGSATDPFVYQPPANGAQFGTISTYVFGATGFMACPTQASIAYQVFANVPWADIPMRVVSDCVPLDFLAVPYTAAEAAAWQYD